LDGPVAGDLVNSMGPSCRFFRCPPPAHRARRWPNVFWIVPFPPPPGRAPPYTTPSTATGSMQRAGPAGPLAAAGRAGQDLKGGALRGPTFVPFSFTGARPFPSHPPGPRNVAHRHSPRARGKPQLRHVAVSRLRGAPPVLNSQNANTRRGFGMSTAPFARVVLSNSWPRVRPGWPRAARGPLGTGPLGAVYGPRAGWKLTPGGRGPAGWRAAFRRPFKE